MKIRVSLVKEEGDSDDASFPIAPGVTLNFTDCGHAVLPAVLRDGDDDGAKEITALREQLHQANKDYEDLVQHNTVLSDSIKQLQSDLETAKNSGTNTSA